MKKILKFIALVVVFTIALVLIFTITTKAQGSTKANKYITATWTGDFFIGGLWYRYITMTATGADVLVTLESDGSTWTITQNETATRYVIDPVNYARKEVITLLLPREIKLVLNIPRHVLCISCVP